MLAAVLLFVAAATFMLTGTMYAFVLSAPAGVGTSDGEMVCFDARRHPTYTALQVPIGTPVEQFRLLLRFDFTANCSAEQMDGSIAVASPRALRSTTLRCDGNIERTDGSPCVDVILAGRASDSFTTNAQVIAPLLFGNDALRGPESADLGLDGEFRPCLGSRVLVGSSRVCIGSSHHLWSPPKGAIVHDLPVRATTSGSTTTTRDEMLRAGEPFSLFGAAAAPCRASPTFNKSVLLLPGTAGLDSAWRTSVAQGIDRTATVARLRTIQDAGLACVAEATHNKSHFRVRALVAASKTACGEHLLEHTGVAGRAFCRDQPTLSYSNVASSDLALSLDTNGIGTFSVWDDEALSPLDTRLVRGSGVDEWGWGRIDTADDDGTERLALDVSLVRLGIMVLAALILWTRREDEAAKADTIFLSCLALLARGRLRDSTDTPLFSRLLGLTAALVRLAVALVLVQGGLGADGEGAVARGEAVAAAASLIHWTMLHWSRLVHLVHCSEVETVKDSRSLLGGSSAVVDIACAVMLVFSETPLLDAGDRFDDTARLLIALLLSIAGVSRVLFSTACSAAGLVPNKGNDATGSSMSLGIFSTVYWMGQGVQLAVVLVRLFAAPFAVALCHQGTLPPRLFTAATFITLIGVGVGPRLCANSRAIIEETTWEATSATTRRKRV